LRGTQCRSNPLRDKQGIASPAARARNDTCAFQLSAVKANGFPAEVAQVQDAMPLVCALKYGLGLGLKIDSHAPRHAAERFVSDAGYGALLEPGDLICSDFEPGKESPLHWQAVLGGVPPEHVLGLDDIPSGARWMLEKGGLGLVIVRPSAPEKDAAEFEALEHEFAGRLVLVREFRELLVPESAL
jgi:hypothetical protein